MKALKILGQIALHMVIILFVTCGPIFLYDAITKAHTTSNLDWISYSVGILSCSAYIFYWLLKIKNERVKIVLMYLVAFVAFSGMGMFTIDKKTPFLMLIPPAVVLLGALAHSFARSNVDRSKSARYAFYVLMSFIAILVLIGLFVISTSFMINIRY
jgi:hypothetical protein